jgi:nitrite reductase (NADH) large subunit
MSKTKAWLCSVCGYVHHGEEPPENCPVCGAPADLFTLQEESSQENKTTEKPSAWRCLNCKYIHEKDTPPDNCPVCDAPADRFEPYNPSETSATDIADSNETFVIIGAGIAGVSAAEAIREHSKSAEIKLISSDSEFPYYRLNLTRYLAKEIKAEALPIKPESWYAENGISLLLNTEVCEIDSKKQEIKLKSGDPVNYTKLILTCGAHAFMPPFAGTNKQNITLLRHKQDADFILETCSESVKCICIGGGILGIEAAGALAKNGVDVTVIEGYDWLLPRQLNKAGGDILEKYATSLGIKFLKSARIKEFVGDEAAKEILLDNGDTVSGDIFIVATGVRSNTYFARKAGIKVNKGIIVDDYLCSSEPNIWAAGDVCEHRGICYGTWGPAQFQGTIAGLNAVGVKTEFNGIPRTNMLKVLGIDLFSIGTISQEDASCSCIDSAENDQYFGFFFKDNHLIGSILIGDTNLSANVKEAIENKTDFSVELEGDRSIQGIIKILSEA